MHDSSNLGNTGGGVDKGLSGGGGGTDWELANERVGRGTHPPVLAGLGDACWGVGG